MHFIILLLPLTLLAQKNEKFSRIRPHLEAGIPVVIQEPKCLIQPRGLSSLNENRKANLLNIGNNMLLVKPPQEFAQPLFMVNGVKVTERSILISKDDIKNIYIQKKSIDQYIFNRSIPATIVIQTKEPIGSSLNIELSENQRNPLYVVDGIVLNENTSIAMDDVENITILGDIMYHSEDDRLNLLTIEIDTDRWSMPDFIGKFRACSHLNDSITTIDELTLKRRNLLYANEWNYRYSNPQKYPVNVYSMLINYNPNESYGLNVEQQLYIFFQLITAEYNISWDTEQAI